MATKTQLLLPSICKGEKDKRRENAVSVSHNNITSLIGFSPAHLVHNGRGARNFRVMTTKKGSSSDNPETQLRFSPLWASKLIIARSAVVLFGLGFLDAGYSGDWSRIGVITRDTEELLKMAAFLVVPLCLFLIFTISDRDAVSK